MKKTTKLRLFGGCILLFNLWLAGNYNIQGAALLLLTFGFAFGYEIFVVRGNGEATKGDVFSEKWRGVCIAAAAWVVSLFGLHVLFEHLGLFVPKGLIALISVTVSILSYYIAKSHHSPTSSSRGKYLNTRE